MAAIKVNEKYKKVETNITTCKGKLIGYTAIVKPSAKFNNYTAAILIPKKDGEELLKLFQEVKRQQYKTFGKGSTAQEITRLKPYVVVEKNEDGEIVKETPDEEGRYILKATAKASIKTRTGEIINKKIGVFDAKGKPCTEISVGEGSVVRLALNLAGYTVAGKTGLSVNLRAVQIIDLVEYGGEATAATYGFGEEEGFEIGEEEDFNEETEDTSEEEDF